MINPRNIAGALIALSVFWTSNTMASEFLTPGVYIDPLSSSFNVCYDNGRAEYLPVDSSNGSPNCRSYYASCDAERCMIVVNGAIKTFRRNILLQYGADVLALAKETIDDGVSGAAGQPFNQPPNGFADPVCQFYIQNGFPCPEGHGFPGGSGTNPGPSSTPLPPGPNDNCLQCTAVYGICFAAAGPNLIAQYICITEFQNCALNHCG